MSKGDEERVAAPAEEDAAGGEQEAIGSHGAAETDPPREPRVAPEDLTDEERGIVATLQGLIGDIKEEARDRAQPGARLQSDVGLDSVAIIDLVIAAEDEFDIEIPDDETGDLMDATLAELARRVGRLAAG